MSEHWEGKQEFLDRLARDAAKWQADHVTIPRAQYEALMAAAKVFAGYYRFGSWGDDAHCAIAALRAAGVETGEATSSAADPHERQDEA